MFEQRIYGRAKEQFVRSDGKTVRLGYGYLVESAGFSKVGSAVNDMVGEFPTQLVDGFGMLPVILVKKAFATDKGEAQLIQQTVQIESDRPYALTHQMIADPESVTSLIQRPDLWMNVYFAAEEYDWGTISLPSTNSIPAGNNVPTAPLSNVLAYFGMGTQTFVTLLCSLFDAIRSSKVYTVVVFLDNMQDYDYWNRCLIVYIYYFMPYSMRRRLGFEDKPKENLFLRAAGFSGAFDFLTGTLLQHCQTDRKFSVAHMESLMKLDTQPLIKPDDVKSLGGRMARAHVTDYFRENYQADLPDNNDSYEF